MKKIIVLTALAAVISIVSFSQNTGFGVNAGAVLASMKGKYQGTKETSDGKAGFTAGVYAKVPIGETISFLPMLNYTQKGGKLKETISGYTAENKETLNYLELLLNCIYHVPAGNGTFFAGIGPVLNFGLSGKYKYKVTGQPDESGDIKFGSDENEDDYKPFDVGGNVLAGYEFSCGVFAALNFSHGFSNLVIEGDKNNCAQNRYFGLRIGYQFSGPGKK